MNNLDCAGVYAIRHIPSGQEYIGSSKRIRARVKQHFSALRNNRHHAYKLQERWAVSKPEDFEVNVLLHCDLHNLRMYESLVMHAMLPELNTTFQTGQLVIHPPRTKECIATTAEISKRRWESPEYRAKALVAIRNAMTPEECQNHSERTKKLWAEPEYRANAVAARKGNAYCKGYKCTPDQVENRKRAARISNMKRNYGEGWKDEYVRRYPEYAKDVQ
jgi:GIY-YIG catalytic domain